jgi:hypothetical protein
MSSTHVGRRNRNLARPHTVTFLNDFARALITLGSRDESLGVWNVPNPRRFPSAGSSN